MSHRENGVSYRGLLRLPGARSAFVASNIGRLSYGTLGLSLLFVVERATRSFGVAGAAVGLLTTTSLLAPVKARLVDRHGQRTSITCLGTGYALVLTAIGLSAAAGVRRPAAYIALAGLAGVLAPPLGPAMRALWTAISPSPAALQRAYSLDVSIEESLFLLGPTVVGALIAIDSAVLALLVTAALALSGSLAMAATPAVAAHAAPKPTGGRGGITDVFRRPGFPVVVVAIFGLGLGLGSIDIVVTERSVRAGAPAAAGWILTALAFGSVVGGLIWGRMQHRRRTPVQLTSLLMVLAVAIAVAAVASNIAVLAVVLAVGGAVEAPAFIVAYVAVERLTPHSASTEANTWINTANNAGVALGGWDPCGHRKLRRAPPPRICRARHGRCYRIHPEEDARPWREEASPVGLAVGERPVSSFTRRLSTTGCCWHSRC